MSSSEDLRIVCVGKTGAGKSAVGNTILGSYAFESLFLAESVTVDCKKVSFLWGERYVSVVDTPGLFDTKYSEKEVIHEIKKSICFAAPGPHVFLVVIRLGKFTVEEQTSVKIIQAVFGEGSNKHTMLLFTGGDLLQGVPVEDFLEKSPKLLELIKKCYGRYHVFNNNNTKDRSQVTELLEKIVEMVKDNDGKPYTNTKMFQEAEIAIEKEKKRILEANEKARFDALEKLKKIHGPGTLKQAETKLTAEQQRKARDAAEKHNSFILNYKIDYKTINSVFNAVRELEANVVEKDKGAEMKEKKCSIL